MSEPRDPTDRAIAVYHAFDNLSNPFTLAYDGRLWSVVVRGEIVYEGESRWEALEVLHNHAGGH